MANFDEAIKKVLQWEGGLTDDKNDLGGLTKYGISQKAYPKLDINSLTIDSAKAIYKRDYWDKIRGDEIHNQKIAEAIFDLGVNAGTMPAVKIAQKICMINSDGIVGDGTISALNSVKEDLFVALYIIERIRYYITICEKRSANKTFFLGWVKRALSYA